MAHLDALIKAWDEAFWEFSLVFEGLADGDVWKRAHPRLLSIGELAGHVAYGDTIRASPPAPDGDLSQLAIKSPFIDHCFRYYLTEVDHPISLTMSADEVIAEVKRVHEAVKAAVLEIDPQDGDVLPADNNWTWGGHLRYAIFHVAYHTGQAYSVRHLMGHTTTDN